MRSMSWQWLTGFFDGEGSVSTHQNRARRGFFGTSIAIGQSGDRGRRVLEEIRSFLAANGITATMKYCRKRSNAGIVQSRLEQHQIVICGRGSVEAFLRGVLPYVQMKKPIVEDTLRFLTIYPAIHRSRIFRELNNDRATTGWYASRRDIMLDGLAKGVQTQRFNRMKNTPSLLMDWGLV